MNVLQRLDASMPWSPEEAMLLDSVRELARERIAPRAAELDRSGAFPHDNVADINALGLNAMFIPEAYGGSPLSYSCYLACVREISAACASTGIVWATNFHAIKPLIEFGNEEQKQRLLPRIAEGGLASLVITEPSAGSDATGMRTRFEAQGDEIVINGQKTFITNGDVADVYLLFGKWAGIDDAKQAISAVIVEKGAPGLTVVGTEDKMGTRASSTATLSFENCRIPRANLLCEPGDGLRILLTSLNRSRPSVAAHALGIARAAFEDAIAYINERRQFKRRVLEFQGIQFLVADLAAELATCEAWLWRVAGMVDSRADDIGMEASILKLKATDLAMRMSTEAVQLLGGYGYCKDYRVERLMRDAKITQIWEGTNQIHRQLIGRSFLTKE
ncbi:MULTISPECIES: acyl-CoA dehydrogenase family protein [Achromobacter]|uniref:Acyl-CoA dehydrogenase n=1 Tax=Achromobacter mucicolens TaxID=1389922 RepID=A0ABM8LKE8_9BURK|nr:MULTISPECIES: acyl-CoA dehydrogenase family protein [Achromobacter]CAB3884301.1 Acyl-CoA dehydrogenase [Achromobacter aegrifaciens]CAB3915359.1 Acyl-CoA dehydrogenase [Achromobacter mucicolens]